LLFDRAQAPAAHELHHDAAVAGDGADRQAVAQCHAAVVYAVDAVVVAYHLVKVRILRKRAPTLHDEVQHALPLRCVE
jgi:hypothetical protein